MHTLNTLAQIGLAVVVLAAFVLGVMVGRMSKGG